MDAATRRVALRRIERRNEIRIAAARFDSFAIRTVRSGSSDNDPLNIESMPRSGTVTRRESRTVNVIMGARTFVNSKLPASASASICIRDACARDLKRDRAHARYSVRPFPSLSLSLSLCARINYALAPSSGRFTLAANSARGTGNT